MKLGIVVVYMVSEDNGSLLDLHLGQIEKNTQVPYTIYASVNRLLPQFRRVLENNPRVKICECPSTELRASEEHSFYLEKLVRDAVNDGASHICILHVDSFPVCQGWFEELAGNLSDKCVLALAAMKNVLTKCTACLFFHRDFYLKYEPSLRISKNDLATPEYRSFSREIPHYWFDSGMGYVFKAYSEGLSWYPLIRSDKPGAGSLHGDMIFHLEGAYYLKCVTGKKGFRSKSNISRFLSGLKVVLKPIVPKGLLYNINSKVVRYLMRFNSDFIIGPTYEQARAELLKDPDAYLEGLLNKSNHYAK